MKDLNLFIQDIAKTEFSIQKKWTKYFISTSDEFIEEIINLIAFKIKKMLTEDYNGLINMLYRADLNESKVKACFGYDDVEVSHKIAKLYVERLIQKYQTRQKFQSEYEGDWD